jgi:hypothetical protein
MKFHLAVFSFGVVGKNKMTPSTDKDMWYEIIELRRRRSITSSKIIGRRE